MTERRTRLGAVGYLNARPLVYGLAQHPRVDLREDVPSRCAALLHEGGIDLGLIPSIEFQRGVYRVVPGLAIAISDRRGSESVDETYCFKGGITEFVDHLSTDDPVTSVLRLAGSGDLDQHVAVVEPGG